MGGITLRLRIYLTISGKFYGRKHCCRMDYSRKCNGCNEYEVIIEKML